MSEVTLAEVLRAREERVRTRADMQARHRTPVISFTMNIAGPRKTSPLIERAFLIGMDMLTAALSGINIIETVTDLSHCGPSAHLALDADAGELKRIAVSVEESCPLGRLFDIDVYGKEGNALTRSEERGCIVCGASGRGCARSRAHSIEELTRVTESIITRHLMEADAEKIASLARESLIREVKTAPKPGLVDPLGNGSHTDMTVDSFLRSADALLPYFYDCVMLGIKNRDGSPDTLFEQLRKRGLSAEADMYRATGGVNTHKGVIYSMGIICGAIGRLWCAAEPISTQDRILTVAGEIAKASVARDLEGADGSTAGTRLYLELGIKGIRGEASLGFPSVRNIALPAYRKAEGEGLDANHSGLMTLLSLIAATEDTNLYKRGGTEGAEFAKDYAKRLLSLNTPPTAEDFSLMDRAFVSRNLSPGGCADLLAITYFIVALESERGKHNGRE